MSAKRNIKDYFSSSKKKTSEPSTSGANLSTEKSQIAEGTEDDIDSVLSACSNSEESSSEVEDINELEESELPFDEWLKLADQRTTKYLDIPKKSPGPTDISQNAVDEPKQPKLKFYCKTKFGNRLRQFNSGWFNLYGWLEYSISCDAAFCFVCRHFSTNISGDTVFVNVGFRNWKRALEADSGFKKHDLSSEHKNCQVKWSCYEQVRLSEGKASVASQINEAHLALVKENRNYIGIIADILLYTATQNIAQRGDKESEESSNRGNFLELLTLFSKHNDVIRKKLGNAVVKNAKYTSPKIQNEILYIFSKRILNEIISEINAASCFSVMCDETKDISKTEQVSVVLRYYLDGTIYERFVGYRAAKNLDAKSLFAYIKELVIEKCGIDMQKCVAQTYDGANVMSGRLNGVQKLFRDEVPQAIHTHCYNHRLNLIVVDVCRKVSHGKLFFDILETLYVFVSGSAMHLKFLEIQKEMNPGRTPIELKRISYTRWTAQVHACLAVKKLLSEILVFLNKLISEQNDRAPEAIGLLHQIEFSFIFHLCMYSKILTIFKGVSDYFQKITSNLVEANILLMSTIDTFTNMRNNNAEFPELYSEAIKLCQENNVDVPIVAGASSSKTGRRIMPNRFADYLFTEQISAENEYIVEKDQFKTRVFLPSIDLILNELNDRFKSSSGIIMAMSALHPENASFLSYDCILPLAEHYNSDCETLKEELKILPKIVKQYEEEKNLKIQNIMQLLHILGTYKIVFSETYKLAVISVTIPVSSAACERTFSCLRRLKTYIRNKMTDERLNHLALINIERTTARMLNISKVIDEFDAMHDNRRIVLH